MADTSTIDAAAKDLGKLIADHAIGKEYEAATKAFNDDIEAQRLMADFSRLLQSLGEKQAQQKPIEVEDKRRLEQVQTAVAMNLQVRRMQKAQMDFLDCLRNVTNIISQEAAPEGEDAPAPGSPGSAGPGPGGMPGGIIG